MNDVKGKYSNVLSGGSYIPLKVKDSEKIIAYARHFNGKTLLVVANKNVNTRETGIIKIPGLEQNQVLKNLIPSYGEKSRFRNGNGFLSMDLGPARLHIFEINTPEIEENAKEVLMQNI